MPSLNINFLNLLHDKFTNYNNFIETGTFHGETIFNMQPFFKNLFTIEIKKKFYDEVISKYNNNNNNNNNNKINFFLGDSSFILKDIIKNINSQSIFFLDGHWSSGDTGKGKKDCPLYEELNDINIFFKYKGIIIIDDVRLFGKGPNKKNEICNWEDINTEEIYKILNDRITDRYFLPSELYEKDRLIIHIKELNN